MNSFIRYGTFIESGKPRQNIKDDVELPLPPCTMYVCEFLLTHLTYISAIYALKYNFLLPFHSGADIMFLFDLTKTRSSVCCKAELTMCMYVCVRQSGSYVKCLDNECVCVGMKNVRKQSTITFILPTKLLD